MQLRQVVAMLQHVLAGWCCSCRSAYPALCKIAGDEHLSSAFTWAKADLEDTGVAELLQAWPQAAH